MWPNNTNYSWGSWIHQNKGNFNASDGVDWASLAKQWMQHKDVGTSDIISDSVESSKPRIWFTPPDSKETRVFQDVKKYMSRTNESACNMSSDVHQSMPAWAVPPPPPPPQLPPQNNIPLESQVHFNQIKDQAQSFPPMWNHAGIPIYPNKMANQINSDFDISTSWMTSSNDNLFLDATKRKQLPAWIREGLQKMEKEKFKRLEKDQGVNIEEKEISQFSLQVEKHESSDKESVIVDEEKVTETSPLTEEEKLADLMKKVRRMLTEILLEVTNEEIYFIANSVYNKAKSRQNKALQSIPLSSALASISTLGEECESEDESDELSNSDDDSEIMRLKKHVSTFKPEMALSDNVGDELRRNKSLNDCQVKISHEAVKPFNLSDMKNEKNILFDYSKSIKNKELEPAVVNKIGLSLHPLCSLGFDVSSCKSFKKSDSEQFKIDNEEIFKDEKLIKKKNQDFDKSYKRGHKELRSWRNSDLSSAVPKIKKMETTCLLNNSDMSKSRRDHNDERGPKEERLHKGRNKKKRPRSRSSSLERTSKQRRYRRDRKRESKSRSR